MKPEYGIQLYSVRDIAQENLEDALRGVSELGYKFVEFAGFFDHTSDEINAMLEKYDLTLTGTHSGIQDLAPDKIEETIKFHKAINNPCYIIPWADFSSEEKIDQFIELVNLAQPRLNAAGIRLAFHNHSFEYDKLISGSCAFKELEKRTDLEFELDTYWIYNAGLDPVKEMKRLKNRIRYIHIKDGFMGGEGVPLGRGTAPVIQVRSTAIELGYAIIVESETLTPSGMAEAKECMDYLHTLDESN